MADIRPFLVIILDTNVLSELMKPKPSTAVQEWLLRNGGADPYTTVMCEAEILVGIALMPSGRRRQDLHGRAEWIFANAFASKVLPFDSEAVPSFAEIVARRQSAGRRIEPPDAVIAAIARRWSAPVATRNVADFEGCGIEIINPWQDA